MTEKDCDLIHERELREQWQDAHEDRHRAELEALKVARGEVDRRLDDMNDLRRQIEAERGKYLLRDLYDKEHDAMRDTFHARLDTVRESADLRLKSLESTKSNLEGRLWAIGAMIGFVVIVINLALHYWGAK